MAAGSQTGAGNQPEKNRCHRGIARPERGHFTKPRPKSRKPGRFHQARCCLPWTAAVWNWQALYHNGRRPSRIMPMLQAEFNPGEFAVWRQSRPDMGLTMPAMVRFSNWRGGVKGSARLKRNLFTFSPVWQPVIFPRDWNQIPAISSSPGGRAGWPGKKEGGRWAAPRGV